MNNIPENILQQVADAAFEAVKATHLVTPKAGYDYADARRAVIQHALSNPSLAPFLAGVGEYTDQAIYDAWKKSVEDNHAFPDRMRSFLAALPRRESPALADPETAAQVPLGPEDMKPGTWFRSHQGFCYELDMLTPTSIKLRGSIVFTGQDLWQEGWKINTSIPDTGRWDENAWRPCSKPGK